MANIELVIKIPEEVRLELINNIPLSPDKQSICYAHIKHAIRNSIPLPNRYRLERELKTGHWIDTGSGQQCSECGEIQYGYDNYRRYCAYCGAKMESEV